MNRLTQNLRALVCIAWAMWTAAMTGCATAPALGPEDFAAATYVEEETATLAEAEPESPVPSELEIVAADDPQIAKAVRRYRDGEKAPTLRQPRMGFVVFPYGEAEPVLTCAPLRVCEVELEPGEEVIDVALGDPARWHAQPMESGAEEARRPHVVLKPTEPEITTNLVVTTTRRVYHLGLVSTLDEDPSYVRSARFYYPAETVARWAAERRSEARARADERRRVVASGPAVRPEDLHFGYAVKGDKTPWRPVQVFDDGTRVFLQMPASMRATEAPALFVESPEGERALVNYRVRGRYYVVDKLFARAAALVLGVGANEELVTIERRPAPRGESAALATE